MTSATLPTQTTLRTDATVISLVGFAHGVSHFFHLMLPALFPWIVMEFGVNFVTAGTLMTTFFVVSGIGQALAGFVVDRFGAHRVLCGGIALLSLSGLLLAVAPGFAFLYAAALVAGLGNSVFHTADFALINKRVSSERLGHAFSTHGLAGNLGWAVSPVLMVALAAAWGWRSAGIGAAVVGLMALFFLLWKRHLLQYEIAHAAARSGGTEGSAHHSETAPASTWFFLRVKVVWLAFAFFFLSTFAFGALQNFAPTLLQRTHGLSLALATSSLTFYLLGGSAGLMIGGFLVKSQRRFEHLIAGALVCGAIFAFALGLGLIPSSIVLPVMGLMGMGVGLAGPSRDMLVRKAAARQLGEGAFGRVYGFVYSGLDLGLALAPLGFGWLLDRQYPFAVFLGIAVTLLLAIAAALALGRKA